ncbi:hypothetical protein F4778DRAFT_776518 [Xylariomycetidae sp. FL2044]|nr:hypothetical protein F4778DRAFT_776518 [Xylariomycetidae sp. FL2044]
MTTESGLRYPLDIYIQTSLQLTKSVPALRSVIPDPDVDGDSWSQPRLPNGCAYRCHGMDLRDLLSKREDSSIPAAAPGLRTGIPTIVLSDCCLCYMDVVQADGVVRFFADRILAELAGELLLPMMLDV